MKKVRQSFKNSFIPHEGNDQKPHILRPKTIAFVVMVALVAELGFVFGAKYIISNSKLYGVIEVNALVDETNQQRVDDKLPSLTVSPLLMEAAQEKANDMATKGYFAHTSPQGLTPWYWFENVGYSFDYAGENLAVNFSDSQDVTNAWMNSPEHRANILSGDFTQIGMATAQGTFNGQPATYVVEEFGTPATAPIAFVNTASAASIPTTAPMPQVVTATPTTTTAKTTTSQPVATTAAKPVAVVPAIVAMQDSQTSSSAQSFVAVKGAATDNLPATPATADATSSPAVPAATQSSAPAASATATPATTAVAGAPVAQSTFIQKLFSNPRTLANDFYYLVMFIFLLAIVLNVFVNIRTQYPRLIVGGIFVIVVAGLCVMLNQNIGFLHAVVL